MKTASKKLVFLVICGLLAWGCSDDDKDKTGNDAGNTNQEAGQAAEQGVVSDQGGTTGDQGTTTVADSGVGKACKNDDGNTHTDCTGDVDYCVPNIAGAEMLGVAKLTCTKKGCTVGDAASCPGGLTCMEVPETVINMLKAQGIEMPATLCGSK